MVCLCAVIACAVWAAPVRAAACSDADAPYTPGVNDVQVRGAILCLVNAERGARGLVPVAAHPALELAANRHLADMAARGFDGHIAPAPAPFGATPHERAAAAGYGRASPGGWEVGETLHSMSQPWPIESPERTTARAAVTSWMTSPPHCGVILTLEARQLGVAVLRSSSDIGWVTDAFALVVGVPGQSMTPAPGCGLPAPAGAPATSDPAGSSGPSATSDPAASGVPLGGSQVRLVSGATIRLNRGAAAAPLTLQCARASGRCRVRASLRVKGRALGSTRIDLAAGARMRLRVPIARALRPPLTRRRTRASLSVQAAGTTGTRTVTLKG